MNRPLLSLPHKTSKATAFGLAALSIALPMLAARVSRSAVTAGYESLTHRKAPKNPAAPEVRWREAIAWTLLTAAVGGMARLVTNRAIADTPIPAAGVDRDEVPDRLTD